MNVCNPTDVNWTNAWQTYKYLEEQVLKSLYWYRADSFPFVCILQNVLSMK